MEHIGRYRVVRPLGHGGMGQVFLAEDPKLERQVALKLLHRDPAHIGLAGEAKALAALSHPGIVAIYEIGEHDGRDFIAMEYLPGKTLRDLIEAKAPRGELLAICTRVAVAIAALHKAGVLHRDIKPENIVVGDTGDVKVVDFGIARRLRDTDRPRRAATAQEVADALVQTMPVGSTGTDTVVSAGTQTVFGTPAYMAPEVLHGEDTAAASDVYSLGVVLYECLSGKRPFRAGTLVELISAVIETAPPPLADPHGALVERMLAREPTARPSIDDVVEALARRDPDPVPKRRRPGIWFAAAGLAMVAAAVGAVWYVTRETAPPAPAPQPLRTVSIAVGPITVTAPNYGTEPPNPSTLAKTLVRLLADVEGARFTGIEFTGDPSSDFRIATTVEERAGKLHARAMLIERATNTSTLVEADDASLSHLITRLANAIAGTIVPGAALPERADHVRAQAFVQLGKPLADAGKFNDARPFLEQAVAADPRYADAWYELALVLAWTEAPEAEIDHAARQAVELAPSGPHGTIMRALQAFILDHNGEARALLEPLDHADADKTLQLELLYYLGEANWHDGRFRDGYAYFKRAIDLESHFTPAAIHANQYALVHGDLENARYLIGLSGENPDAVVLAAHGYEDLAEHARHPGYRVAGYVLAGREPPADLVDVAYRGIDRIAYDVARAAAAGDLTGARDAFAAGWRTHVVDTPPTPADYYGLEQLAEVVIAAGMTDEARIVVRYLAAHPGQSLRRGLHRFQVLGAPLTGDPAPTEGLSSRNRMLAAGELNQVLDDPSFYGDFVEKVMVVKRDGPAHCKEWLRPPVFRIVYLQLRAACAATKGSKKPGSPRTRRR